MTHLGEACEPSIRRRRRTVLVVAASLVLVTGTGCIRDVDPVPGPPPSSGPSASPTATLPPVGVDCRDLATQGRTLRLRNGAGMDVAAVDLGSGSKGVVLAHQSDASMCQWLPYATLLAQEGYRVVVFDFVGFGASSPARTRTYLDDIRTAVQYLRDQGTTRVVVVGASMGATMAITAAAAITPPVAGVVAVSPPKLFDGVNAERAASQLETPALYIAADSDGDYEVYAEELSQATPAALRDLLIVDAPEHGVELVRAPTPQGDQVRTVIRAFLEEQLNPPPSATPSR
jgi:pimeloyl-ACP methyl ester carboxylesterase